MNNLVDSSQLGIDLKADVVDCLGALWADGGVLLEDNLRRDAVERVTQSLDAGVGGGVLHWHDDHDHVRLPRLGKLLVQSHKLRLDP